MLSEDTARQGTNWYIYTSQTEYYIENDWGLWKFLNTDRYYAEVGGSRYQANSKETLYLANGILYNRNEAGNFVLVYFLESKNVSGYISGVLAQGGSIIPTMANMTGLPRLDEEWDRKARWAGVKYYYDRNNQWWIYYVLYGGRIKY